MPRSLVVSERDALVSWWRNVTVAPGTGRPVESLTVPRTTPVVACAWALSVAGTAVTVRPRSNRRGVVRTNGRGKAMERVPFRAKGLQRFRLCQGRGLAYRWTGRVARRQGVHRGARRFGVLRALPLNVSFTSSTTSDVVVFNLLQVFSPA